MLMNFFFLIIYIDWNKEIADRFTIEVNSCRIEFENRVVSRKLSKYRIN